MLALVAALVAAQGCGGGQSVQGDRASSTVGNSASTTSEQVVTTQPPATTIATTTTTLPPTTTTLPPTTTTTEPLAADSLSVEGFAGHMGEFTWAGVIIIESTASGPIVVNPVRIEYRIDSGAVLDTDNVDDLIFYPGTNYLGVTLREPRAEPADIAVNFDAAEFTEAERPTITGLQVDCCPLGEVYVTGEIHTTFTEYNEYATLTLVFFNEGGSPLFAATKSVYGTGDTWPFEQYVYVEDGAPAWEYAEVYASR